MDKEEGGRLTGTTVSLDHDTEVVGHLTILPDGHVAEGHGEDDGTDQTGSLEGNTNSYPRKEFERRETDLHDEIR